MSFIKDFLTSRDKNIVRFQAVLVTILWSSSWLLIKIGLRDIPPLTFAGLRYVIGAVCLWIFFLFSKNNRSKFPFPKHQIGSLIIYGLVCYTLAQGMQFVSLNYLPAVTTNLILSNSPVLVAIISRFFTTERMSFLQWLGIPLAITGSLVFFLPIQQGQFQLIGYLAALVCVSSNAISSIMGYGLNRRRELTPLTVTLYSMTIGSAALLMIGVFLEPFPILDWKQIAIILWLSIVNTAFAFTLWNNTLKHLLPTEASMLNSLMMVEIPLWAYFFLGEEIGLRQLAGMIILIIGILAVQIGNKKSSDQTEIPVQTKSSPG